MTKLFRQKALEAQQRYTLGKAMVMLPVSLTAWLSFFFFIAIAFSLFVFFGIYAKKQDVVGYLKPDKGILLIYPDTSGTVQQLLVTQGEKVTKNQPLLKIKVNNDGLDGVDLSQASEKAVNDQISLQQNIVTNLQSELDRMQALLNNNYISFSDYQKKYAQLLDAKSSLDQLKRQQIDASRSKGYSIVAPDDGVVATLNVLQGDSVSQQKPLMSILPKDSQLLAELFVPSNAIGFVHIGQKVLLKYQAYPYQQFGVYEASVIQVDKSIMTSNEINAPIQLTQPFYRVIARLKSQDVLAYNKPYSLQSGMLLDAQIVGEKRTIWQWMLNPIYSLRGALTT